MDNRPIGFLDSGVGGLTVVGEFLRQIPNESIVYIGDSARVPYGSRTSEEIVRFTWEMVLFLLSQDVKMIIFACNTITAICLKEIKEKLDIPIIGVIFPGALAAIRQSKINKIAVIATQATINSGTYEQLIKERSPEVEVYNLSCPQFVPIIEESKIADHTLSEIVSDSLRPLIGKVDALILGCTHFPLIKKYIQEAIGEEVELIDSGVETVHNISKLLTSLQMNGENRNKLDHSFYVTGDAEKFRRIAERWLNRRIDVEKVMITKPTLILATRNSGKVDEFKEMFSHLGYNIKSLNDIEDIPDIEESGKTFEENARLKAETIAELTGEIVIGDDSGLCVDVLGGLPGIWSHRFAGKNPTDIENNAKLLHELASTETMPERRTAHFHTTLVAARRNCESLVVEADWDGYISVVPRGDNGFGYDSIFLVGDSDKTAAELPLKDKNRISHRGQALQKLLKELPAWLNQ